jgi:tRNA A-37 threonylcarbamoyl transferase component Bud32
LIERTPLPSLTGEPNTAAGAARSPDAIIEVSALKAQGSPPAPPFAIRRSDGSVLSFSSILRHLPGKRIVGEAYGAEGRVLAKLFIGDAAKRHWQREASGLQALDEAGIPTPEMITREALPDGGYLLLTRYIDGATTLADQISELANACSRDDSVIALLAPCFHLVGKLHASGLVHHDLHPGNFLVADGRIMLVDGDAVSGKPLTPVAASEACANLALLIVQFPMAWTLEPARLLAGYRRANPPLSDDAGALDGAIRRAREKRTADYLDKAGRNCSRYIARRSFARLQVVARDKEADLRPLLDDPDGWMAEGEPLKQGNTATVYRIRLGGKLCVVKRYNIKGVLHAISRSWRPTRGWHSWLAAHRLQVLGIATPRPLAIIENRFGPLRGRAWFVTENCPGDNLRGLLDPAQQPNPNVGDALVGLFRVLVAARITHGDLKATNLLWHDGRIHLIDLDALTQHDKEPTFREAWARDRERLLANWPAQSPLNRWLDAELPGA